MELLPPSARARGSEAMRRLVKIVVLKILFSQGCIRMRGIEPRYGTSLEFKCGWFRISRRTARMIQPIAGEEGEKGNGERTTESKRNERRKKGRAKVFAHRMRADADALRRGPQGRRHEPAMHRGDRETGEGGASIGIKERLNATKGAEGKAELPRAGPDLRRRVLVLGKGPIQRAWDDRLKEGSSLKRGTNFKSRVRSASEFAVFRDRKAE
ncbi:hypothetical protein DFH09DRAFT_1077887 [Mycena vulgaris]|nr:hypothetical protein DFH09DRAFT_1077887 [Mycena vulgaris]